MEIFLCPCHRHVKESTFLPEFGGRAGAEIRWDGTVDYIEDED